MATWMLGGCCPGWESWYYKEAAGNEGQFFGWESDEDEFLLFVDLWNFLHQNIVLAESMKIFVALIYRFQYYGGIKGKEIRIEGRLLVLCYCVLLL